MTAWEPFPAKPQKRHTVELEIIYPVVTVKVLRQVGEYIREMKMGGASVEDDQIADWLADEIEAQTKPSRIPEPSWGATIRERNGAGFPWTRFSDSESHDAGDWINHDGVRAQWTNLIDPVLVREGLS